MAFREKYRTSRSASSTRLSSAGRILAFTAPSFIHHQRAGSEYHHTQKQKSRNKENVVRRKEKRTALIFQDIIKESTASRDEFQRISRPHSYGLLRRIRQPDSQPIGRSALTRGYSQCEISITCIASAAMKSSIDVVTPSERFSAD